MRNPVERTGAGHGTAKRKSGKRGEGSIRAGCTADCALIKGRTKHKREEEERLDNEFRIGRGSGNNISSGSNNGGAGDGKG